MELTVAKELIIVNNCSTNGSAEILKNLISIQNNLDPSRVQPWQRSSHSRRSREVHEKLYRNSAANMEVDLGDIPKLMAPLLSGKADVVYGSRFKKTSDRVYRTFHYLANRLLTIFSNTLSGLYLSDMETCYKFFRADVIKNIKLE